MSAPIGKWVVVRSDRLVLSVDKADHPYVVGRARQLPSAQLLTHKYASREQLTFIWHPPHLYMLQTGKNPSVLGPSCTFVPSARTSDAGAQRWQQASVHFCAAASVKEATAHEKSDGTVVVEVPLSDPLVVTQPTDRQAIGAATVHFPEELGLPTLTVRFEGTEVRREDATAAATSKTAAEMLAVPSARAVTRGCDGEEDEEDDLRDEGGLRDTTSGRVSLTSATGAASGVGGNGASESGSKPEWRGLLDVALQQQQQQQQQEARVAASSVPPATSSPAPPPVRPSPSSPPAPPVEVPFGGTAAATPPATGSATTPAAQKRPAAAAPQMGFWEWKQHAKGSDSDPASWRKYNLAVAKVLEEAYRDPKITKLKVPDAAMFDKPGTKGSTYGVCFAEKSLKGQMIQYKLDDPDKFRVIRRTGGTPVDRKRARSARVLPSPTTSDESDSEESVSSPSSSSSSSSEDRQARRRKRPRRA